MKEDDRDRDGHEKIAYLHTDHLNTPRFATDSRGRIVWRWTSDAFGDTFPARNFNFKEEIHENFEAEIHETDLLAHGVTINLRFPGQYFDQETGFHYNWHRYYNPEIGRYVTSDPVGLRGGINTYAYVANNPLGWTDPLGFWTFQIGIALNFQWGPLVFPFSGGIAFDGLGNIAGFIEIPIFGIGTGAEASGGVSFRMSNGDTIFDLAGPFTNISSGGGWGPFASGDAFFGFGQNGQRVEGGGITIGIGLGAGASVAITNTFIGQPLFRSQPMNSCGM